MSNAGFAQRRFYHLEEFVEADEREFALPPAKVGRASVKRGDGSGDLVCDARSAEVTYTTAGTVVNIKGPALLLSGALEPITVGSVRLTFADGKLSEYEHRIDGRILRDPRGR